MTVVQFPRQCRHKLPEDAIPKGRDRHATVFPFKGKWAMTEQDEGGGSFVTGLTKKQAIAGAVELVMH
jgi:hypothetical protein